ncbi:hypothetical protein MPS_0934 [Mycobacterium pseudoshottsii JCM 15466]|nr:hypothetical protein MPS_0934 [Mycobacterium pseudoshottsii JCM 15466]
MLLARCGVLAYRGDGHLRLLCKRAANPRPNGPRTHERVDANDGLLPN